MWGAPTGKLSRLVRDVRAGEAKLREGQVRQKRIALTSAVAPRLSRWLSQ